MNRITKRLTVWSLVVLVSITTYASDLVEIIPLTPNVIALHFNDGYADNRGYHSENGDTRIFSDPLNLYRATHPYSYRILSTDDDRYLQGLNPVRIGRKSKPSAFSDSCIWTHEQICDNEYVLEHWIYLELPDDLEQGKSYTIWMGNLARNLDEVSFVYNVAFLRSEMIHVNQHGYKPSSGMKYGYLSHWAGDFGQIDMDFLQGKAFQLVRMEDNSVAFEGMVARRRGLEEKAQDFGSPEVWGTTNNVYGSDVWEADFSAFSTPGAYRLVVEGVGCSFPFKLDENAYREAYYYTARGLYHQRAGIAKEEAFAGKWAQARDHHPDDGIMQLYYTKYPSVLTGEGNSSKDSILAHLVGEITSWGWGWYHDAGDWDGYVHHTQVPYFLLASYELAPQNFRDNELNIPESGNGIPDVLDEAGWLINYFRRNIQPGGGVAGGRINSDFNSKPASSPSYEDNRPWYVSGEDPQTSYLFAGLALQYAYCLEMAGITSLSSELLEEAKAAYAWAGENHQIAPDEKVNGASLSDLRMYAAANLFKLTGEISYQDEFIKLNQISSEATSLAGGTYNQTKAVWSYVTSPDHPGIDGELKALLKEATIKYAINDFLEPAKKRSARMGYSWGMPPIVGSTTTPVTITPMFAQHVAEGAQKQEFIDYMETTADYFLGNNPLNMSWISGLGDRNPERFLHLDSRYRKEKMDEYLPGIVPYGPLWHGDHFMGEEANGPHDADFAKIRSYPDRYDWPNSEFWFDSPYSVMDGEFTVHQNSAPAASSYGFLSADTTNIFVPNESPEISILSPSAPSTIDESDSLKVEVNVADDRTVTSVTYFLGHHPVKAESGSEFNTAVPVKDLPSGTFQLRARALDSDGAVTWAEGPELTIEHNYKPVLLISPETDTLVEGQSLDVLVDAAGITGATVEGITLYLNGTEMGNITEAPYQFSMDSIYPLFNEIKAVVRFYEGFESAVKIQKYAEPGVAGVSFKKKEIALHSGEYVTLEYAIFPEEAKNWVVAFQSTDEAIAKVNAEGRVEAISEGVAHIIVSTSEGGFTDTTKVSVLPPRPEGPYGGKPAILPMLLEAEHFDYGGEGLAYHDNTPGNGEEIYRFEDVDVGESYDEGAAFHVTDIDAGEWLNYTVYVPETNSYDIRFRYTAGSSAPSLTLKSEGELISTLSLPLVGWYPFKDYLLENIPLSEGEQTLTLQFDNGAMTLNYFEILCENCTSILPQDMNLNYHDLDVAVGGKVQLVANMLPLNTTNKKVFWKIPDDGVIFLDQSGNLTALKVGTSRIIAESEAMGLTDTCMVNVLAGSAFSPGLNYEYFEGDWSATPEFASKIPEFAGSINNFDISPATSEDFFGFRFFGEISIYTQGSYFFYTSSDDGSLLYINGQLVVDNDGLHAMVEQGGTIELDSGRHQIEVLFFEKEGGADLDVSYEGPGISKASIPDTILGTFIVGGELIPLQGIVMSDTLLIPLDSDLPVPLEFIPSDASDRAITFTSGDPSVVQLDPYGNVKGMKLGTASIKGMSREGGFTDSTTAIVINDTPRISILSPREGSVFSDTASIRISFTISDTIGGVMGTMFYLNDLLEQSSELPVNHFDIGPLAPGSHVFYVKAEDQYGANGRSETVNIIVEEQTNSTAFHTGNQVGLTILPNPFNDLVQFRINILEECRVILKVYDLTGSLQHISEPVQLKAGESVIEWDGKGNDMQDLPQGAYLCRFLIDTGKEQQLIQRKLVKN